MMEAPELIVTNSQGTAIVTEQVRHPRDVTYIRSDLLIDPNAVHMNMLRGTLAKPSVDQIVHIYGPEALAASPEVAKLIADAEARNRSLMLDALAALVSARDTIRKKWATSNPARDKVIADLCEVLGVEVVPAEAAAIRRAAEETGT